jgi:hypothetical protein
MKIYFVVTISRQIEGEMMLVKFEKAYKDIAKAQEYANTLLKAYTEKIETPDGVIEFMCQRGIHEIILEE